MDASHISNKTWIGLFAAVLVAYVYGLFVPLMEGDASHHADIALHMYLHHDYVNLIDSSGADYLDKPHFHFWLVALSYQLFGVTTLAYKLPSFLFTVLGAYSTYRLGRLLYNKPAGLLAALIFVSAQAEFLANNDVRMDALLTAAIIFATWQLAEAAYFSRWYNYLLSALGLAMAFTTKGMIGLVQPCVALFFLLLYQRNWGKIFNWRWLVVILLWAIFVAPCVYCYYLQYDLHPEKVIRGMSHVSGVRFILWSQNFERLNGSHWGTVHKDYFFFFHTLLWAFLPWCLLTYAAFFSRMADFIKNRFAYVRHTEFLTAGTIIIIFAIISSSGFQLPHYLNVLFPFFGIIVAGYLIQLQNRHQYKTLRIYGYMQYAIAVAILIIIGIVNIWCFPVHNIAVIAITLLLIGLALYIIIREQAMLTKLVAISALIIVAANVMLNGNTYPQLLNYQASNKLAQIVEQKSIPKQDIYTYAFISNSFDFYTQTLLADIRNEGIRQKQAAGQPVWLLTDDQGKNGLLQAGFKIDTLYQAADYRVTRLGGKFMNPDTRSSTLQPNYLLKVSE